MKISKTFAATLVVVGGLSALPAVAAVTVYSDTAPPEQRVEVVPPARANYAWTPGYWNWDGQRYSWMSGVWVAQQSGQHWVPDRYEQRDGHYYREAGHWERS